MFSFLCFVSDMQLYPFQDRAALLEDDMFMKGNDGNYFSNSELHNVVRGVGGSSATISAPRLAFVLFKLMQFLGRENPSDASQAADEPDAGSDEPPLYREALNLCIRYAGRHFATHLNFDGSADTRTLLNIIVPAEVPLLSLPPPPPTLHCCFRLRLTVACTGVAETAANGGINDAARVVWDRAFFSRHRPSTWFVSYLA